MDMESVRKTAKEKLKGFCRVCPVCNGVVCAGEVPGMGGVGTGSAFMANIDALASYSLNMRTIHAVRTPDTAVEIFGRKLALPVLAAPITGSTYNMGGQVSEDDYTDAAISGCAQAGTIGMTGDAADPSLWASAMKALQKYKGVSIIKPRAQQEIIKRIRESEDAGAIAVGMDIDGAGLVTMALKGQPVSPKTKNEIKELVSSTNLPFILKGIMTPDEAELAVEAGVSVIVVSNHGGRVLDHTPGTAEVLPEIADRVEGSIKIFVDGGVRSGADVLKMLALGADAVLVGRPLIIGAFGGGSEGVALVLNKMKSELAQAMLLTGTAAVKKVSRDVLYE